ncbi:hypothetical protein N7457_003874 [Penicillium paradoxum]|uniref:uncharacterized protein n=1 Tax=Penicillium paradoxum TaxID=176176 RepID=UPI002546729E|nr:uncharacterized protein N7457_003874 [Penicillium paradoxum]KAJ5782100.1 hypothetical protein N7457_003874 [Penicillium paradoxum]
MNTYDPDDATYNGSPQPNNLNHTNPNPTEFIPPGVEQIISRSTCHIGKLNENTVLKYAPNHNSPLDLMTIKIEARLLHMLGPHPRIIQSHGLAEDGLMLKYYPNGDLHAYLAAHPFVSMERRLEWCKQLVDTVGYVHSRRIIHCDITLSNLLLDENHDIILADFQGLLVASNGKVLLDGLSREPSKSFMPRRHNTADVHTDLFAVGSAIYHLVVGHDVFPELDSVEDEAEIGNRFKNGVFPPDDYVAGHIVERCWRGLYSCAAEVSTDISEVQAVSKAVEEAQRPGDGL